MNGKFRSGGAVVALCIMLAGVAACAGPVPAGSTLTAAAQTVTPATATATDKAAGAPTAAAAATAQPAASPAPTPAAGSANATAAAGALSETELRYKLIDQFGALFYCDPDMYPVARSDLGPVAAQKVPTIQQNEPEKYQVMLNHLGLGANTTLNSAQTLLVYQEYKKLNAITMGAAGDGYTFALRVPDTAAAKGQSGFAIAGSITRAGAVSVSKKDPAFLTCPICLAADAQIDTPAGPVAVTALQVGMPVWTMDGAGRRVAGVVEQVAHTDVPATHQVVRLRLADGREVRVSPGHPTADGRRVGELAAGDAYDGSRVASAEREAYAGGATYDLLPSGASGAYWANGILLGSTLR